MFWIATHSQRPVEGILVYMTRRRWVTYLMRSERYGWSNNQSLSTCIDQVSIYTQSTRPDARPRETIHRNGLD